jgi:hypothetical protein
MRIPTTLRTLAALALVLAPAASVSAQSHAATAPTSAADLRATLNTAFQEHVYLAAAATGAALGGRQAEFDAAAGALDANSVAISRAIGLVYGADAERAFLPLWRKHIGFFVDYTTGAAAKDRMKQEKAVGDLMAYAGELGAFLSAANPNLPKSAVEALVKTHAVTLKSVVDAQAMGDQARTYAALREAAMHMRMIADPIAGAIAKQFPERFASR